MKRRNGKTLCRAAAVMLSGALLAGSAAPLQAAGSTAKEENVYVNLKQDGSVDGVYVVNAYRLEQDTQIVDYGNYESVKNLSSDAGIESRKGTVTVDAKAGEFFYQGNLRSKEIPWEIAISYTLDGKKISAEELAGKNGRLKISIHIGQNDKADAVFFENYLLQVTLTMDMERCSNLEAPGATAANVGTDKQLVYSILAGSEKDITVTADVLDFEMDAISIQGLPMNLDVDRDRFSLDDLHEKAGKISDAADEFSDGAQDLAGGVDSLKEGAEGLRDGAESLKEGIDSYADGTRTLGDGIDTLQDGSSELADGARELADGTGELANGISTLLGGISQLSDGYKGENGAAAGARKLADGVKELKTGSYQLSEGVSTLVDMISGLGENSMGSWEEQANALLESEEIASINAILRTLGYPEIDTGSGEAPARLETLSQSLQDTIINLASAGLSGAGGTSGSGAGEAGTDTGGTTQKLPEENDLNAEETDPAETEVDPAEGTEEDGKNSDSEKTDSAEGEQQETGDKEQEDGSGSGGTDSAEGNSGSGEAGGTEGDSGNGETGGEEGNSGSGEAGGTEGDSGNDAAGGTEGDGGNGETGGTEDSGKIESIGENNPDQISISEGEDASGGESSSGQNSAPEVIPQPENSVEDSSGAGKSAEPENGEKGENSIHTLSAGAETGRAVVRVQKLSALRGPEKNSAARVPVSRMTDSGKETKAIALSAGEGGMQNGPEGGFPSADLIDGLLDGLFELKAGADQLLGAYTFIGQITASLGSEETLSQLAQLKEGAQALDAGIGQLESGTSSLADGIAQLADGTSQLVDGTGQLADGAYELADGGYEFADGTQELADGVSELADGMDVLNDASDALRDGSSQLADGSGELADGTKDLADGVSDLKEGTDEFKDEAGGIDGQIDAEVDEVIGDLSGSGFTPVSFVSDKNTNVELVQFAMRTEGIRVPEETNIPAAEEPMSFWQRLLALFGL